MKLYKTTIVIWSDFDPQHLELDELAHDAVSGESYYGKKHREQLAGRYRPTSPFYQGHDALVYAEPDPVRP